MDFGKSKTRFLCFIWWISTILGIPGCRKMIPETCHFDRGKSEVEEVGFYSRGPDKKVFLRGLYFPTRDSSKCIIIIQGYGMHLDRPEEGIFEIIPRLIESGYNVLIFDLRARGKSSGNKVSLGRYEVCDLLGARDFLVKEKGILPRNIGLLGFSYGAMVCILAAVEEEFAALVLDSVPGDIFEYLKRKMKKLHIPIFLLNIVKVLISLFLGINVKKLNTREVARGLSSPLMLIYGKKDSSLFTSARCLYWVKIRDPRDKIWVTNASHSKSFKLCPEEYMKNLIDFFEKTLKPASD